MHHPSRFSDHQFPFCLLQCSLYGLEQAPRVWYHIFAEHASRINFTHSCSDPSMFVYRYAQHTTFLLLCVDDIILSGSSPSLLQQITRLLGREFSMIDLGLLTIFLDICHLKRICLS